MKKRVSIIIPVYNVEKYIGRCLESILKNTYKDIEIILINDGSKDNSQAIIDEYAQKYSEIIISKEQENSGPAEARNNGMKIATRRIYNVY